MLCLDSKIDGVTVFRSGGQVTRVADLRPQEGEWPSEVRLTGLPLSLDDQSLRIVASYPEGGYGVLPSDLRVDLDLGQAPPAPPTPVDTEPFKARRRRLKLELELLREDLQRTGALEPPVRPAVPPGQPPAPFQLEPRRELLELRQDQLRRLNLRHQELTEELNRLDKALLAAEAAHQSKQTPAQEHQLRKAVVVGLRCLSGAQPPLVRLHLSYQVAGARWAPAYTLRFDRDATLARLEMRAAVCQSSGEDWTNVELALSTANPSTWKELPELPSRRIGRSQAGVRRTGWRPAPVGAESLFGDFDRGPSREKPAPAEPTPVTFPSIDAVPDPFPGSIDPFIGQADPFASQDPFEAQDPFGSAGGADPFSTAGGADPFAPAPSTVLEQLAPEPGFGVRSGGGGAALGGLARDDVRAESRVRSGMLRASVAAPASPPLGMAMRAKGSAENKPMLSRSAPPVPRPDVAKKVAAPWAGATTPPRRWQDEMGLAGPGEGGYLEVGQEHLAYGLLRMPRYDEGGRGKLQAQSPVAACVRLLRASHPDLHFDPFTTIDAAWRAAQRALQAQPPQAHRYPGSIQGFDYLYNGQSRVDLPSDCQFHSLPLLVQELTTRMAWVSVPRVSADVFRQAEVESLPDLAFPSGPVDVFVGRDYLLTTSLGDLAPGGTLRLGLGVEQGIKVARNTTFKEATAGMMGGTLQLRHTIEIEVANRTAREVQLEVREALPQAQEGTEDVKVKLESCQPNWEQISPESAAGTYRWRLPLGAGEKTTLKAIYIVEMSSKLELVGGNRREE